jgi:hypothetical protein
MSMLRQKILGRVYHPYITMLLSQHLYWRSLTLTGDLFQKNKESVKESGAEVMFLDHQLVVCDARRYRHLLFRDYMNSEKLSGMSEIDLFLYGEDGDC